MLIKALLHTGYYYIWHNYFGEKNWSNPQHISTAYYCLAHVSITAIHDKDHIDMYLWYNRTTYTYKMPIAQGYKVKGQE